MASKTVGKKLSRRVIIFIVAGVVILVGAAAAGFFILKGINEQQKKDDDKAASQTVTTKTEEWSQPSASSSTTDELEQKINATSDPAQKAALYVEQAYVILEKDSNTEKALVAARSAESTAPSVASARLIATILWSQYNAPEKSAEKNAVIAAYELYKQRLQADQTQDQTDIANIDQVLEGLRA